MKKVYFHIYALPLLLVLALLNACSGQEAAKARENTQKASHPAVIATANPQIAEYIRHIFQDKNGDFWFGTNGYGVAHYAADSIAYFSPAQGFNGQQITGITQDADKNIWQCITSNGPGISQIGS